METAKWVTLYTGDPWMLEIESMEFGKDQQGHSRENRESWSALEEFKECRWENKGYLWL